MSDNVLVLQPYFVSAFVTVVLIVVILFIRSRVKVNADVRQITRIISSMGLSSVKEIVIPDEIDGFVTIDYCVLTPKGVLVILIQNYAGNLFGGDSIDSWTQVYLRKSYQFNNPLRHREKCLHAIQEYLPGIPVVAQVVFTDVGTFPKGKPSHVSMLHDVKQDLSGFFCEGQQPSENVKTAWRKLEALKWSDSGEGRAASIN